MPRKVAASSYGPGEELVPTEELLSSPFSTTTQTVIKFTVVITSSSAPPVALTTLSVRASMRSRVVSSRDSPFLAILLFCALSPVYTQDCNGPPQQSSSCTGRTSTVPPPVSEVPLEAPPSPVCARSARREVPWSCTGPKQHRNIFQTAHRLVPGQNGNNQSVCAHNHDPPSHLHTRVCDIHTSTLCSSRKT